MTKAPSWFKLLRMVMTTHSIERACAIRGYADALPCAVDVAFERSLVKVRT